MINLAVFIDIAYHIGVDRDGNLYELRDTAIAGDTDTKYDPTGHFESPRRVRSLCF